MSRDILAQLANPALLALRCAGHEWPRTLLAARPVPTGWIALRQRADGGRVLVVAGEDPDPHRDDALLLVRQRDAAVALQVSDSPAAGGERVSAACTVRVRVGHTADDLAALSRVLTDCTALTDERLARRFVDAGADAALRSFIRARPAAELVSADQRDALLEHLRSQLARFLFESGLSLEAVPRAEFASEALQRAEALRRRAAEQVERIRAGEMIEQAALAATHRRLDDLSAVLRKLTAAAAADPAMQWHELLPALTPAERGRLLENLWRITPDRHVARAIVVVSGDECLWLDPLDPEELRHRVRLDADLGGLRSVSFSARPVGSAASASPLSTPSGGRLVVGAATGVWLLDAQDGRVLGRYAVPDATGPRTGFNAAIIEGAALLATHSQLGCWRWALDDPDDVRALLRPVGGVPRTVRGIVATADGRIVFAADDAVRVLDAGGNPLAAHETGGAAITCVAVLDDALYVGTENGMVLHDRLDGSQGLFDVLHRVAGPVESIHARRWNDLVELVIPAGLQGVCGVYGGEGVVARLLDARVPIRRAWASDDVIVGLTEHRESLIVTNANMPQRASREVRIGRITGHSIQDACVVFETRPGVPQPSPGESG